MAEKPFRVNNFSIASGGGKDETIVQYLLASNSATTVDSSTLSTLSAVEYAIEIDQGTKRRFSKLHVRTDGTTVSSTEYGVVEIGGAITGLSIAVSASGGNAILQVTVGDAATTNAFLDITKKVYYKVLTPWGLTSVTPTNVGTSRAFNNGAASVAFISASGGTAPSAYQVVSSPGGFTASGSSSPIVVAGLSSNTSYSFTVTPLNANGYGPALTSSPINITTVSSAPIIGTATTASATSATVTFTAPTSDGGSAVTGYTVTSSPGGITGSGASSPITVTGLGENTYTFSVTATNANGTSAASNASNSLFFGAQWLVAQNTTRYYKSVSGTSGWSQGTPISASESTIRGVGYGAGQWIVGVYGSNGGHLRTSPDMVTWTTRALPSPFSTGWQSNANMVAGAGDQAFISGWNGNMFARSTDGITWTSVTSNVASNRRITSVAYGNGIYVLTTMTDGTAGQINSSTDGISWTTRQSIPFHAYDVDFGNNTFVTVGLFCSIFTSTNGISWTTRSNNITPVGGLGGTEQFGRVRFSGGKFVATYDNGRVIVSTNGITWTSSATGYSSTAKHFIAAKNSSLWLMGNYANAIGSARFQYSTDAITWTTLPSSDFANMSSAGDYWASATRA